MADSFPGFEESSEISNRVKGTKTYYILVRSSCVESKGYNADIFSYDARQLDERMETFRFAELSKKKSRMAPTGN